MIYSAISIACILLLAAFLLYVVCSFLKKSRDERINALRNFKKGKCVTVYVLSIPLYTIGRLYGGQNVIDSFFSAMNDAVSLVVANFDTSDVAALMADNRWYVAAITLCYTVVVINAVLFTASLIYQNVATYLGSKRWEFSRKSKLLLVGNNGENEMIYRSEDCRIKAITDSISEEEGKKLYSKGLRYISKEDPTDLIFKQIKKSQKRHNELVIVINTHDDEKNISLCKSIITALPAASEDKAEHVKALSLFRVYVFGDPRYEDVYNEVSESSMGTVRYVNKYRQIAVDFIDRYPVSHFMTEEQLDVDTALIREGVNINLSMIGFGKTNRQIFLTSVANNQFITEEKGEIRLKQVNYTVFDKCPAENNKNLNHSYYRFKNELLNADEKDFLPFPDAPANESYYHLDINSPEFYTRLKGTVTASKKDVNMIVIAFGTDLENLDLAQKLLQKRAEWNAEDTVIFVKVRSGNRDHSVFGEKNCYLIGDEAQTVYNISRIDNGKLDRMAKMRNRVYSVEYEAASSGKTPDRNDVERIFAEADYNWYAEKTTTERESNIYGCLSIRSKLGLMGLDYGTEGDALTESEYLDIYSKGYPIEYIDGICADGKKIVKYGLEHKASKRTALAIHEHYRWNSFMISKGTVPATKEQILSEKNAKGRYTNGKNYPCRRHGNLTTFDGLVEFRQMIAARDNASELQKDVIKYDFQLMDDAHWILSENGYVIFKKQ